MEAKTNWNNTAVEGGLTLRNTQKPLEDQLKPTGKRLVNSKLLQLETPPCGQNHLKSVASPRPTKIPFVPSPRVRKDLIRPRAAMVSLPCWRPFGVKRFGDERLGGFAISCVFCFGFRHPSIGLLTSLCFLLSVSSSEDVFLVLLFHLH